VRRRSITANAQGLILSTSAAGTIVKKNFILSRRESSEVVVSFSVVESFSVSVQESISVQEDVSLHGIVVCSLPISLIGSLFCSQLFFSLIFSSSSLKWSRASTSPIRAYSVPSFSWTTIKGVPT
jgi:hypothetical protein